MHDNRGADYEASNDADRERLRALVARLSDAELRRPLDEGWTVAATLAHFAFWDRFVLVRWEQFDREATFLDLPDRLVDLVNAAMLPQWRALAPRRAAELALAEAEAVDRRIAALAPEAVRAALATNRLPMLDRSRHRRAHLDELERAVG